jgi:hypothetical protein
MPGRGGGVPPRIRRGHTGDEGCHGTQLGVAQNFFSTI